MPRPVDSRMRYEPALDGIRAFAVVAVIAYHLELPFMPGGLLGVGVFFTLSGYLITSILLESWARTGGLELGTFWLRRARRLLPALMVMLAVVLAATLVTAPALLGTRTVESVAAALYVSNWVTIAGGDSYFDRFEGPAPLDHLWSLAIEEQFYVLWPLVLLGMLTLAKGRLRRVMWATVALAAVSFVALALVANPGFDNTRAYEGTDTRAGGLLVGAALAIGLRRLTAPLSSAGRWHSNVVDALGAAALVGIAALMVGTDDYSMSLYTWGILALSVFTAVLIVVAIHPSSRVVRPALGTAPMRWLGERSYGIYLWHLPVIAFTPDALLEDAPIARAAAQVGITLAIAALSWTLVEDPIRRAGGRRRAVDVPGRTPTTDPSAPELVVASTASTATTLAPISSRTTSRTSARSLAAGTTAVIVLGTATLSACAMLGPTTGSPGPESLPISAILADEVPGLPEGAEPAPDDAATDEPPAEPAATPAPPQTPAPLVATPATTTSCTRVVHVGDSTSVGLMSKDYLPNAKHRIDAQYRAVGVAKVSTDIKGARSIVETFKDQPNARDAVTSRTDAGYTGCWVIAMGTNDTANQVVGSTFDDDERIDRIMSEVGSSPTLWLTVKTLRSSGPYANKHMAKWNASLVRACERYPNMRVYDWASQVRDSWYISDGIHFTSEGYRKRANLTARALATAFPQGSLGSPTCLVTPN